MPHQLQMLHETICNSVEFKLSITFLKLVGSLIGSEVTVQCIRSCKNWSKIRMSFKIRERDIILQNKISVSTIKLPELQFKAFHEVSLFE